MTLFDSTSLVLQKAMSGAAMRQSVLSSNLANANTPGYVRKDVDFHSTLNEALGAGDSGLADVSFTPQTDAAAAVRQDGNTVDVDREAAELAANGLEYQALVSVAQGRISIIQSALGVR